MTFGKKIIDTIRTIKNHYLDPFINTAPEAANFSDRSDSIILGI